MAETKSSKRKSEPVTETWRHHNIQDEAVALNGRSVFLLFLPTFSEIITSPKEKGHLRARMSNTDALGFKVESVVNV